jgi:hypothetical protein
MDTVQGQPTVFDAEDAARFAALMAGFDTGNPSESEAISKARALRRMAAERKLRLVDVLELPEIRQALDDQMQPLRRGSPESENALDALREELTERTRDVRVLAEELAQCKDLLARREGKRAYAPRKHAQTTVAVDEESGLMDVFWIVLGLVFGLLRCVWWVLANAVTILFRVVCWAIK